MAEASRIKGKTICTRYHASLAFRHLSVSRYKLLSVFFDSRANNFYVRIQYHFVKFTHASIY